MYVKRSVLKYINSYLYKTRLYLKLSVVKMVHKFKIESGTVPAASRLRSVSSQIVACMSPNLLLLDLGMAISFSTIALPDLLNASEGLSLDERQASWFGSVAFLAQPIGALLSGPMVDYCGRKKANFIANLPHVCAWLLMFFCWNLPTLFLANILLGFGTGVMEAPINSYVGEVSEPTIRGALCTLTQLFSAIGVFVMYFLGTVVDWRRAALICLIAPILSMLLILLVPDSPVWLLVHGHEKEALKSLCYLRGWTTPENVREEFDDLVVYAKTLQQCVICQQTNNAKMPTECEHNKMNIIKRLILKFRYVMLCKETLRPILLVLLYFTFLIMSGLIPTRPNMVNMCGAFGMADDGKNIVLMIGILTLVTSIVMIGVIKIFGKRKLALISMFGAALACAGLSGYARNNIKDSVFSFDTDTFPETKSYVPLVLFYLVAIFNGFAVPWVLLGEVFPFRSRATAQGIAAALNYVVTFIATKTYIDLETSIHLSGTFAVYAAFSFLGTIYLYFFLPETEGKSLQEIESYYSGEIKTFADDPVINLFKRFKR